MKRSDASRRPVERMCVAAIATMMQTDRAEQTGDISPEAAAHWRELAAMVEADMRMIERRAAE